MLYCHCKGWVDIVGFHGPGSALAAVHRNLNGTSADYKGRREDHTGQALVEQLKFIRLDGNV